ncbi:holdfast attachment protein HfaA [Hirschia baltica ATCC 49814]|uniref:Holdfast attachment protein HfaA n=2 Tax=Hirschia TaxID=2723 RepID=C6XNV0_HIRBI|nr:holdfast attachment protein HfaA [Hirschia baltica ATCC 49814]
MTLRRMKTGIVGLTMASLGLVLPAIANPAAQYTGEFERPYGFSYGQESQNYDASSRDINGNRVIIDGRIVVGDDLSSLSVGGVYGHNFRGAGAGYGSYQGFGNSTAVGNQLNVITNGSNNIVVIDSHQTNSGDQTVILNGELDLND